MTTTINTAYDQLTTVEKLYVDGIVRALNRACAAVDMTAIEYIKARKGAEDGELSQYFRDPKFHAPLIQAAIMEVVCAIERVRQISVANIIDEVDAIARSNMGDYFTLDANGLPFFTLDNCTRAQLGAIQAIEVDLDKESGQPKKIKIKLYDKLAGLEKLMRYKGMYAADKPDYVPVLTTAPDAQQITAATSNAAAADLYARTLRGVQP